MVYSKPMSLAGKEHTPFVWSLVGLGCELEGVCGARCAGLIQAGLAETSAVLANVLLSQLLAVQGRGKASSRMGPWRQGAGAGSWPGNGCDGGDSEPH